MFFEYLLKGLIIGFSIAAPVGPIGILVIKRSLSKGRLSGFISGLGAATADTLYGLIAGLGFTAISTFLISQKLWIQLIGLIFLLYLAIKIFFEKPIKDTKNLESKSLLSDYFSVVLLTITNPMTILSFVAVFAAVGLGNSPSILGSIGIVLGVLLGSGLWWLLLSTITSLFKEKVKKHLIWINRIAGLILFGFAIFILINLII